MSHSRPRSASRSASVTGSRVRVGSVSGIIKSAARIPRPSGLGRKRRSSVLLVLVRVAISPMEWLTIAAVNPLHGAGRRFEIARAGGPDGPPPHVDARLGGGGRHDGAHDGGGTDAGNGTPRRGRCL